MKPRRAPLALLTVLAGTAWACGRPPAAPSEASDAPRAEASASPSAGGETAYSLGDYVVYRYTGRFTPRPVVLREQIVHVAGNRLHIEVSVVRGDDRRRWVQVVTDTPENQKNNVVDELYEIVGGKRVQLPNEDNADLLRLYSWTLVMPDGRPTDIAEEPRAVTIGERDYACMAVTGRTTVEGRPVRFEDVSCPDFVWTHAYSRFLAEDGAEILQVEVIEAGRRR
jgi:hypothetical protein